MNVLETLYPDSPNSIIEVILEAPKQGAGIIPCGKGHLVRRFISPGCQKAVLVSTEQLDAILDLDVDNLSVQAQAGVTLSQLQQELDRHNIFLPISVESHGHRTLGGLIVENAGGYEAYRYGPIQEQILGLEFVTPYGTHVKTGGKTVKNVSGYDTTRLFSRSWGTLGFITAVTFKLKPQVESKAALLVECASPAEAFQVAERIKNARLSITALKVFQAGGNSTWCLLVNFAGFTETIEQHLEIAGKLDKVQNCEIIKDAGSYWDNYYQTIVPDETKLMNVKGPKSIVWQMAEILWNWTADRELAFCEIDLGTGDIKLAPAHEENRETFQQEFIAATDRMGLSYDWVRPPVDPLYQKLKAALDPHHIMFPCHKWLGGEHLD